MGFFARRLFLVGAVLAALAMLMTPALAGADDDDDDGGGGGDRAFCAPAGSPVPGQCSAFGGSITFDFDASSGPLGENPTGTYRESGPQGTLEMQVTCLQVSGPRAFIGGTVTASDFIPAGRGFAFTVLDNSPAASDLISARAALPEPPMANTLNCGTPFVQPTFAVAGDIVVQDNTAGGGGDDDDEDDDDGDDDDEDDGDDEDDDD
jgi:hypothetical protein